MVRIKEKLQFSEVFSVNCKGKSDGLAILWTDPVKIRILTSVRQFIDTVVNSGNGQK